MLYGIISDIHANLEALEVALDHLRDVNALVCPGDIVGYGPNPNECCDIIREKAVMTVLGNHDAAVVGRTPLDWFNPLAHEAAEWTRDRLTAENRAYLEELPLVHRAEHFALAHGSLSRPEDFPYVASPWESRSAFAEMDPHRLCFIGHTHLAQFYSQKAGEQWADEIDMSAGGTIQLKPDFLYIVNCGSIGQPRDLNAKAGVGIYDTEAGTVEILRLEYPVEMTQTKMREAGLPEMLWRRLESGT